jgi:hypothetical protein
MRTMSYVGNTEKILTLLAILRHVDQSTKAGRIMAKIIRYQLWLLRLAKF